MSLSGNNDSTSHQQNSKEVPFKDALDSLKNHQEFLQQHLEQLDKIKNTLSLINK